MQLAATSTAHPDSWFKRKGDTLNVQRPMKFFLVRGLTRESGHWGEEFIDSLEHSFPESELILMDLPGSGEFHKQKSPSTVGGIVRAMRKHNKEYLDGSRQNNVIIATSLGAMVAMEWTLKHPNDFQAMVLVSASAGGICSFSERVKRHSRWKMFRVMLTRNLAKREALILQLNTNDTARFQLNLEKWLRIQTEHPMSKRNILRQSFAGMRYKLRGQFPDLPMLHVASFGDQIVSEKCVRKVHDKTGGDLVWHYWSGHGIPIDDPDWLVGVISQWVYGI